MQIRVQRGFFTSTTGLAILGIFFGIFIIVGGIFTAEDAWEKLCAGASLIQLYTGFIYEGPSVARRINEGLVKIMSREGIHSLDEAVGSRVAL